MPEAHEPNGKVRWRAWARERRDGLTIDHAAMVAGLRDFLGADDGAADGWVLTYRPRPGEVDLDALLPDWRCAVTRTHAGGLLTVHPADGPMEHHRFGYLQPVAGTPEVSLADVTVALVPGVAFDPWGNRLGHGVGHYDRLLPGLAPRVPRVGVTSGALVTAVRLPTEHHDIPMTHLATEAGVRQVQS